MVDSDVDILHSSINWRAVDNRSRKAYASRMKKKSINRLMQRYLVFSSSLWSVSILARLSPSLLLDLVTILF